MGCRVLAFLVVMLVAATASAQHPPSLSESLTGDAKAAYDAGKLLIADGDLVGAEIKFKAAYDLSHDARLLWNMAACEKGQRHYARAVGLVRQYVDQGGALLTDQDRADASTLLDTLRTFTIKLTITSNEPGADVSVDGVAVGKTPLGAPVVVDLGTREIVVTKTGFKDASRAVTVGAKPEETVDVSLVREVHEGTLTIITAPKARILLDGVQVGVGRFSGRVRSGGRTLRVDAEGARPAQEEIVIADDQTRTIELYPDDRPEPGVPVYRGFEGRFDFIFAYGFTGTYKPPPGVTAQDMSPFGPAAPGVALRLGYSWGWLAVEGFGMFLPDYAKQQWTIPGVGCTSCSHIETPTVRGVFGVAARATSKAPTVRATGSAGLGLSVASIFFGRHYNCNNNCSGGNTDFSANPGYATAALAFDGGMLVGSAPGAKFFLGAQALVEFVPSLVVGPDTNGGGYQDVPPTGWNASWGPVVYLGLVLGIGFGH